MKVKLYDRALSQIGEHPWIYGSLIGGVISIAVSQAPFVQNLTYDWFVKPRIEIVQEATTLANAFEGIVLPFYDPKKTTPNVRFYRREPAYVAEALRETQQAIDDNRTLLERTGQIEHLNEESLETAIIRVDGFIPGYPHNNADQWFAYLTAGSTQDPPSGYAIEIQSFYDQANGAYRDLIRESESTGEGMAPAVDWLFGISSAFVFWMSFPFVRAFLEDGPKKREARNWNARKRSLLQRLEED